MKTLKLVVSLQLPNDSTGTKDSDSDPEPKPSASSLGILALLAGAAALFAVFYLRRSRKGF